MKGDNKKTKAELIAELDELRARLDTDESGRYRQIVEGLPQLVFELDADGLVTYVNEAVLKAYGYTREDIANGMSMAQLLDSRSHGLAKANLARVLAGEDIQGTEYLARRKDGTAFPIKSYSQRIEIDGELTGVRGMLFDISDIKQAEQALLESQKRARALIDQASHGIYQCTPDGKFLAANTAMATILGYDSAKEMIETVDHIGEQLWVNPEKRLAFLKLLKERKELQNHEIHLVRRDGEYLWAADNIRAVFDDDGEISYYEGILQDITLRKQNERITKAMYAISNAVATTRDLEALYASIHEIIGGIIPANNFYIGLHDEGEDNLYLVYHQDEKEIVDVIPDVSDPDNTCMTLHVLRTGEPLYLCLDNPDHKQMQDELSVYGSPPRVWLGVPLVLDDIVIGVMAVFDYSRDITYTDDDMAFLIAVSEQVALAIERKSNEEALTQLNEILESKVAQRTAELEARTAELEKANLRLTKLDRVKSSLVSSVSHELRTPLTSIRGFAKLCSRDFDRYYRGLVVDRIVEKKGARICRNLDIIDTEGDRLTRLINDFLNIDRIESGAAVWHDHAFNPCDIIKKATEAAAGGFEATPGVELVTRLPKTTRFITADPDKIHQVVSNLLHNAYKFTKEGTVTVSLEINGRHITVAVADTGPGIPEQELPHIFEKFHKARPDDTVTTKGRGAGLGLAICKEIVEHYSGTIEVNSELGQGTTFSFTLPTDAR